MPLAFREATTEEVRTRSSALKGRCLHHSRSQPQKKFALDHQIRREDASCIPGGNHTRSSLSIISFEGKMPLAFRAATREEVRTRSSALKGRCLLHSGRQPQKKFALDHQL